MIKFKKYIPWLLILLFMSVLSCANNKTVYGYVVTKPKQTGTDLWKPVMRVTFRVDDNKVITEVAGLLDEYRDCTISDKNNWECRYEDDRGSNKFGFKDGNYWHMPGWGSDIKYVSRWKYNIIRCKWYQYKSGIFKGTVECLRTYI